MHKLYGISQCDQVKKAKKWLTEQNLAYEFYDFKQQGLDPATLKDWLTRRSWQDLFNTRSTSYRALDEKEKQALNQELAISIMQRNPTIIKRPVLDTPKQLYIGFNLDEYQTLLENTQ